MAGRGALQVLVICGAVLVWLLPAQARPQSRLQGSPVVAEIDRTEAAARLVELRASRPASDLVMVFRLEDRGGAQRTLGLSRIGVFADAVVNRMTLVTGGSSVEAGVLPLRVATDWLLVNGPVPAVWTGTPGVPMEPVPPQRWLEPMDAGLTHTPFDILLPFLFWEDFTVRGVDQVKGRTAYLIELRPPEELVAPLAAAGIGSVRIALDREFNAPLLAEYIDQDSTVVRTVRVVSLKKTDDIWVVRTTDVVDEERETRSRFRILGGGAVDIVPAAVLDPGQPVTADIVLEFDALGLEWF